MNPPKVQLPPVPQGADGAALVTALNDRLRRITLALAAAAKGATGATAPAGIPGTGAIGSGPDFGSIPGVVASLHSGTIPVLVIEEDGTSHASSGLVTVGGAPGLLTIHDSSESSLYYQILYACDASGVVANYQSNLNELRFDHFDLAGAPTGNNTLLAHGGMRFNDYALGGYFAALFQVSATVGAAGRADGGGIPNVPILAWDMIALNVGIGTTAPDASAKLDVASVTQGFAPPRMTTAQKTAIVAPVEGLMVYDLTLHKLSYWNASAWINL